MAKLQKEIVTSIALSAKELASFAEEKKNSSGGGIASQRLSEAAKNLAEAAKMLSETAYADFDDSPSS